MSKLNEKLMLKNLLIHSLRALNRQKSYVILNIIGLSVGIACSLLIALFVINELSYDKFLKDQERIYRVILDGKIGEQQIKAAYTCSPLGPAMLSEVPEVEKFVRINEWGETILKNYDQSFSVNDFMEADSSFFSIFSIALIKGDIRTVLNEPHTLVLSESQARKIFGDTDPVDKMISVGMDTTLYRVTGVFKDIPENSHLSAGVIASFMTNDRADNPTWMSNSFFTYVVLKPGTDASQVDLKLKELIKKYVGPEVQRFLGIDLEDFVTKGNRYSMFLQPLGNIHLDPTIEGGHKAPADPKYLWIFACVAILIIIIASINFMNLATAQAASRAREVGMKKVSGSSRSLLISQFLAESVLLSLIALVLALLVVNFTIPYFNELLGSKLQFSLISSWYVIPMLLVLAIVVGVFAGSYPSFYLSSFQPVNVLKGKVKNSMKNGRLRSVLVVLQFSISVILIVGTLTMFRQVNYLLGKDLGFDKEQLMVITRGETIENHVDAFKEEIMKINGVQAIASSTAVPGRNNNNNGYMMKNRRDETFLLQTNWVDPDFFKTYKMKMVNGREFDLEHGGDKTSCIINSSAVRQFGLTEPLSTVFLSPGDSGLAAEMPVVGVVQDFNFESLHSAIGPYVFRFKNERNNWGYFSIRLDKSFTQKTVNEIESVWKNYTKNDPMDYYFMDDDFNRMYAQEKQSARLALLFAVLAIIIASLGLFGLTSYSVQQRTKEIGIRKTMGASTNEIFYLIAREILILVSVATLIAWPVIYKISDMWLQNFFYRIGLNFWDYIIGFVIALIISLITISYQTLKTARINPAFSLRYE
jgi:putative ABC transport system permease protein